MILDKSSRVIGTITFAGRKFEMRILATSLAALNSGPSPCLALVYVRRRLMCADREGLTITKGGKEGKTMRKVPVRERVEELEDELLDIRDRIDGVLGNEKSDQDADDDE